MNRSCSIFIAVMCFVIAFAVPAFAVEKSSGEYAGTDTCLNCHKDQAKTLMRSPHWKKAVPGSPINAEGCESCHGPGAAHAESGGGKGVGGLIAFAKNESADKRSGICLRCHENSAQLAAWDVGTHRKKDVACDQCHFSHSRKIAEGGYGYTRTGMGYRPTEQYQVCGTCHLDVSAAVNRRSHHPIVEGRLSCSSCHQPHGSIGPSMIKEASVNELCYKCHADKRGPYMWEHPPVEENCSVCHAPHGSVHQRLMVEKIPNLCQGCHDTTRHPGTRYSAETLFTGTRITGSAASPSNRSFARSCVNCHNTIHGSNAPANPSNGYNSGTFFVR